MSQRYTIDGAGNLITKSRHLLGFQIEKMLAKPYFDSDFEDGDTRTGNSDQTIYHNQSDAEAAAEAGGGVANYSPDDGYYVVSFSDPARAEYNYNQLTESSEEQQDFDMAMSERQMALAEEQAAIAREQWEYYQENYQPVETEWIESAMAGLPVDYYVGRATADVQQAYAKTKDEYARELARYGIDPSSPQFQAMNRDIAIAEAAAEAGARTTARMQVNDVNYQRMSDVVKTGRGVPTEASSALSSASTMYGGAANTANAGFGAVNNAYTQMGSYYQTSYQAEQDRQAAGDAAMYGAVGSVAGATIGAAGAVGASYAKNTSKCIPKGTFIDTPTGPVYIEDIRVGDIVIGMDGENCTVLQKHDYLEAENKPDRWREFILENGSVVRCCDEHRLGPRMARAKTYHEGDRMAGRVISKILPIDGVRFSFDLYTDGPGSGYMIGDVPVLSMIEELARKTTLSLEMQHG